MRSTNYLVFALAFVASCSAASEHAEQPATTPSPESASVVAMDSGAVDSIPVSASAATPPRTTPDTIGDRYTMPAKRLPGPSPVIRALYVNRWAAQSRNKMGHLIDIADTTEINGFVIDMKDEFGLNYNTENPTFARNSGNAGAVPHLRGLLDTLRAHGIAPIARIVVFKDSVTARVHPEWTIRKEDGSPWLDKQGAQWVNPYHQELWNYNIGVAEELVKLGFEEIQFDYIRFPEPYKSLPPQVFPGQNGISKPDALAAFLRMAERRLHPLGARTSADIFGLVTTVRGALEVGQEWERISPVVDVVLPMVYPSHYPRGAFGIEKPNADPYTVVYTAIKSARERDAKLGISDPEHVRPWLQAFTLGSPDYGPEQIRAQKQAVYDAGSHGWVLWHPGSQYNLFLPALAREMAPVTAAAPASTPAAPRRQ